MKRLKIWIWLSVMSIMFTFPVPLTSAQDAPTNTLYLDFKKASLLNVLTILSELTGINFMAGKEVAGREVNMVLDGVTLDDALEALTSGTNVRYDFLPSRNIYLFRAAADKETEPPLMARVFKLYYLRASELREISGGTGNISSGSSGSSSSSSSGSSSGGGSLSETQSTGESSSSILTIVENILSERGKVKVDDRSNSLVVIDTEDRLDIIEQAIAQLDRPLQQVLIQVYLIETLEDFDRFLGTDWSNSDQGNLMVIAGGTAETRFPFNAKPFWFDKNIFKNTIGLDKTDLGTEVPNTTTLGTKNFTSLTATFKALQSANKVKVLAKPRILVLDNHPALIKITTNAAIGSSTTNTAVGQLTSGSQTQTERAEVGTTLRFTPLINTDNRITLTIEPRFATVAASTITLSNSGSATGDVTTRTARTTLMLNDGQTIGLGGLLQSSQTNFKRKMPIVGDVPFIGEIFTRRSKQLDDRELILFVTPSIVRDPAEAQAVSVPDERERMNEADAPEWRVKRKPWYKNLMKERPLGAEPPEEIIEIDASSVAERDQAMDSALKDLSEIAEEASLVPQKEEVSEAVPTAQTESPEVSAPVPAEAQAEPPAPEEPPKASDAPRATPNKTPASFLGLLSQVDA